MRQEVCGSVSPVGPNSFFTNDMFQAIAEQSTLYATQNGNLTTKFSTCDIEQLTGIRMMMALVPMSRYWMYWLSI
ncbi:hypothetical protein T4E_4490 [Trichinella pseudospiralis]|uniref:PiggyBac transposable element-derived protein domain-containing protein n=1 Tax=Trichinella pseudospiralis TaxID=6337 RepID=A0A0V0Y2T4_TRIPS|nr:hypothetical protein T4E_4490 [Trichinella pseudospiralis]